MMALLTKKFGGLPIGAWIVLAVVVLGGGMAYTNAQPNQASWRYGACKEFLNLYERFPQSIVVKEGWETAGSAVISYNSRNPFGSEQIRVFECHYSTDKQGRMVLSKITLDRKTIPDEKTKRFSAMLPTLAGTKLDNSLPKPLPSNLNDLQEY